MRRKQRYTYADYEAAKAYWVSKNPGATAEQYQQAMTAIARRMGL